MLPHRSWPELVMHVLAHVPSTAPASSYDPVYVDFCASHVGPARGRTLAEDAHALHRLCDTHEKLAAVQLLAWLFDDAERARLVATADMSQIGPSQVDRPVLLAPLVAQGDAVELLRCAAELEREAMAALPPIVVPDLAEAIDAVTPAAPQLADHKLLALRSLRLRGRVFRDEIWIGIPSDPLELTHAHVAWQAAHEATVAELQGDLPEREIERRALALLTQRAADAGLAGAHAVWLSHLG